MSAGEQLKVVAEVERQGRGKRRRLREFGISRSRYYWWTWRQRQRSRKGTEGTDRPWNRLRPEEEVIVDVLEGRREEILARRKEVQRETFEHRRQYNQEARDTLKRGTSSL
jgi:hypothetical protein